MASISLLSGGHLLNRAHLKILERDYLLIASNWFGPVSLSLQG